MSFLFLLRVNISFFLPERQASFLQRQPSSLLFMRKLWKKETPTAQVIGVYTYIKRSRWGLGCLLRIYGQPHDPFLLFLPRGHFQRASSSILPILKCIPLCNSFVALLPTECSRLRGFLLLPTLKKKTHFRARSLPLSSIIFVPFA